MMLDVGLYHGMSGGNKLWPPHPINRAQCSISDSVDVYRRYFDELSRPVLRKITSDSGPLHTTKRHPRVGFCQLVYKHQATLDLSCKYLYYICLASPQTRPESVLGVVCSDDANSIRQAVLQGLKRCDVILTISGSSTGRHDNVLGALRTAQDCDALFHGVRVVPIRPSGVVMTRGKPAMMILGHDVSTLLLFLSSGYQFSI